MCPPASASVQRPSGHGYQHGKRLGSEASVELRQYTNNEVEKIHGTLLAKDAQCAFEKGSDQITRLFSVIVITAPPCHRFGAFASPLLCLVPSKLGVRDAQMGNGTVIYVTDPARQTAAFCVVHNAAAGDRHEAQDATPGHPLGPPRTRSCARSCGGSEVGEAL